MAPRNDEDFEYSKRAYESRKRKEDKGFFKLPEGETRFRILKTPPGDGTPAVYMEYLQHFRVGKNNKTLRCGKNFLDMSGECWLCRQRKKLVQEGRTQMAQALEPQLMFACNIAVYDKEMKTERGPLTWVAASGKSAKSAPYKLLKIIQDHKTKRNLDHKTGYWYTITRVGTGMTDTTYGAAERDDEPSAVSPEIVKRLKPFSEILYPYDEEAQKKAYYGREDEKEEAQADVTEVPARKFRDEEEEPVRRKFREEEEETPVVKKRRFEEEDEEVPRKKSKFVEEDEEEAPAPKKRRIEVEEEDEAPPPKKRRVEVEDEEEEPPKKKRSYDEDDEDLNYGDAEEEEEEVPKKKKRPVEEDEEEEPRPKKRRVEVEEEEEETDSDEEPAPKKKKRPVEVEEDEDEAPPPKKRRVEVEEEEDDEPPRRPKRPALEEDEDEAPPPKKRRQVEEDEEEDSPPKRSRR